MAVTALVRGLAGLTGMEVLVVMMMLNLWCLRWLLLLFAET